MPGVLLVSDRMPVGQAIEEILLAPDCLVVSFLGRTTQLPEQCLEVRALVAD
ncbi:MAG: hypothetical protein L0Z62_31525 [Gemmataceae bacterium]|nr:hypothetical protein [Gemmataceae bacterium]